MKWLLRITEHRTATTVAWEMPRGKYVFVPVFDHDGRYPEYVVDRIVEELTALGENPLPKG